MNTIRSNLDASNKLHWCIGKAKGCIDEDSREVCDKCIPGGRESIAQIIERVANMPDVELKTGIIHVQSKEEETPEGDDSPEEKEGDNGGEDIASVTGDAK